MGSGYAIHVPTREELERMTPHDLRNRLAALEVFADVLRRQLRKIEEAPTDGGSPAPSSI